MSDLIDAINKVSANADPEKAKTAKINVDALNTDFFASEVKPTAVPQAQAVQSNSQSNAQSVPATPATSTEPEKPANATNTDENKLDAEMAINFVDVVLSRMLQIGFAFGGVETTAKDFQLTPDEVRKLKAPASVVLNKYGMNLSPEWWLVICVVSIYGAKIMMAFPEGKAKGDAKKARIATLKKESSEAGYSGAKRGRKSNAEREKLKQAA